MQQGESAFKSLRWIRRRSYLAMSEHLQIHVALVVTWFSGKNSQMFPIITYDIVIFVRQTNWEI